MKRSIQVLIRKTPLLHKNLKVITLFKNEIIIILLYFFSRHNYEINVHNYKYETLICRGQSDRIKECRAHKST